MTSETKWTYGKQGTAFEVALGDVWKVGPHTFVCSDFMADPTLYLEALAEQPPTLLYSDPPWGQALVNGFRTKAGAERATYTWQTLYEIISGWAVERGIPLYLEGSKPDSRDGLQIPGTMLPSQYTHQWGWFVTYGKKNAPSGLYYGHTTPVPPELIGTLTDVNDIDLPRLVMEAYGPSGVVADPCGGRGNTSRQAHRAGWSSVLNEMNVHRLSAALARAEEAGMGTPEKVA
jgi:hypothetical protein